MGDELVLRGKVFDSVSLEPLRDVALGGRTFTDGRETDYLSALIFDGTANNPPPAIDGTFDLMFSVTKGFCTNPFAQPVSPPEFPRPDRIEIIVIRGDCEQTFSIDINEDTVVDLDFPGDVLELKDPILVEPCAD